VRRRDRHGRGLRGPLSSPNALTGSPVRVPQRPRGAALFAECLQAAVTKGVADCPQAFVGVDIGFEEIPANLTDWWGGQVPLAAAQSSTPERNAAVVLFRRPLEHRAATTAELRRLVHRTLIEQLAALTGIPVEELYPGAADDGWD
jgi:hypothetical protein